MARSPAVEAAIIKRLPQAFASKQVRSLMSPAGSGLVAGIASVLGGAAREKANAQAALGAEYAKAATDAKFAGDVQAAAAAAALIKAEALKWRPLTAAEEAEVAGEVAAQVEAAVAAAVARQAT